MALNCTFLTFILLFNRSPELAAEFKYCKCNFYVYVCLSLNKTCIWFCFISIRFGLAEVFKVNLHDYKKSQSHKSKDPLKTSLVMEKKQDLNIYKQLSINNKRSDISFPINLITVISGRNTTIKVKKTVDGHCLTRFVVPST